MIGANHAAVDSSQRWTVLLPPCCQAWAAEQVRPWTHRSHPPAGGPHDDPEASAAGHVSSDDNG